MNPDNPTPREELEARLTALLLGELPEDEAAALRATLAQDPELAALHTRLQQTIPIVRETAATPATEAAEQSAPLRLTAERREKLLASFKTITPPEFVRPRRFSTGELVLMAAAVVLLLGLASLFFPVLSAANTGAKAKAVAAANLNGLKQTDGPLEPQSDKKQPGSGDAFWWMTDTNGEFAGRSDQNGAAADAASQQPVEDMAKDFAAEANVVATAHPFGGYMQLYTATNAVLPGQSDQTLSLADNDSSYWGRIGHDADESQKAMELARDRNATVAQSENNLNDVGTSYRDWDKDYGNKYSSEIGSNAGQIDGAKASLLAGPNEQPQARYFSDYGRMPADAATSPVDSQVTVEGWSTTKAEPAQSAQANGGSRNWIDVGARQLSPAEDTLAIESWSSFTNSSGGNPSPMVAGDSLGNAALPPASTHLGWSAQQPGDANDAMNLNDTPALNEKDSGSGSRELATDKSLSVPPTHYLTSPPPPQSPAGTPGTHLEADGTEIATAPSPPPVQPPAGTQAKSGNGTTSVGYDNPDQFVPQASIPTGGTITSVLPLPSARTGAHRYTFNEPANSATDYDSVGGLTASNQWSEDIGSPRNLGTDFALNRGLNGFVDNAVEQPAPGVGVGSWEGETKDDVGGQRTLLSDSGYADAARVDAEKLTDSSASRLKDSGQLKAVFDPAVGDQPVLGNLLASSQSQPAAATPDNGAKFQFSAGYTQPLSSQSRAALGVPSSSGSLAASASATATSTQSPASYAFTLNSAEPSDVAQTLRGIYPQGSAQPASDEVKKLEVQRRETPVSPSGSESPAPLEVRSFRVNGNTFQQALNGVQSQSFGSGNGAGGGGGGFGGGGFGGGGSGSVTGTIVGVGGTAITASSLAGPNATPGTQPAPDAVNLPGRSRAALPTAAPTFNTTAGTQGSPSGAGLPYQAQTYAMSVGNAASSQNYGLANQGMMGGALPPASVTYSAATGTPVVTPMTGENGRGARGGGFGGGGFGPSAQTNTGAFGFQAYYGAFGVGPGSATQIQGGTAPTLAGEPSAANPMGLFPGTASTQPGVTATFAAGPNATRYRTYPNNTAPGTVTADIDADRGSLIIQTDSRTMQDISKWVDNVSEPSANNQLADSPAAIPNFNFAEPGNTFESSENHWASFDGSTNAPITNPDSTKLSELLSSMTDQANRARYMPMDQISPYANTNPEVYSVNVTGYVNATNETDKSSVGRRELAGNPLSPTPVAPITSSGLEAATDRAPAKTPEPPPTPQPEILASENAFSTFSLNVSDVSFKLAGASLQNNVVPDAASIRSEEFINAFDYRDPDAAPGVPVSFAWERARYPFAHNRDLLRFSIKTAASGRLPGQALNIVLLLDNSGSMQRSDRVAIIREALRVLAGQLQPQDRVSIVTFARAPRLWKDGIPGDQVAQVLEVIAGLTPEGGTNLGDALDLAYATALRHYLANGVNRVVLLTDGAANLGDTDPEQLKQKVQTERNQGIALDCFGIGWEDYNDDLLEVLTRNADGRYGFLNTPAEARTDFAAQLAGALHVAASDVKVQVEFNSNRVVSWRQIGYAKHQLTKEQFRDNTVHAAQIGAAEAGNGLYTVEIAPQGSGPICTVHLRYRDPGTTEVHEHSWEIPYNGDAVALEQASPAMRLAATASAFSEELAHSPYAAEVTDDQLLNYLRGVPECYGADTRPKQLQTMIQENRSLTGK